MGVGTGLMELPQEYVEAHALVVGLDVEAGDELRLSGAQDCRDDQDG